MNRILMESEIEVAGVVDGNTSDRERSTRGFWALIVTQFQGAYSDNILRNLLLSMIVGMGMSLSTRESFAWVDDQTTSTRKTIPAVVELAPIQTSAPVVPIAISAPTNQ